MWIKPCWWYEEKCKFIEVNSQRTKIDGHNNEAFDFLHKNQHIFNYQWFLSTKFEKSPCWYISLPISNIFIENFVENNILKRDLKPSVWWCYNGDVFTIWRNQMHQLHSFFIEINEIKTTTRSDWNISKQQTFFSWYVSWKKRTSIPNMSFRNETYSNEYLNLS